MSSARYFHPIVTKVEFSGQNLINLYNIQFHGNPSTLAAEFTYTQTDTINVTGASRAFRAQELVKVTESLRTKK